MPIGPLLSLFCSVSSGWGSMSWTPPSPSLWLFKVCCPLLSVFVNNKLFLLFHVFCWVASSVSHLTHPNLTSFPVRALLGSSYVGTNKLDIGETRAIRLSASVINFSVRGTPGHTWALGCLPRLKSIPWKTLCKYAQFLHRHPITVCLEFIATLLGERSQNQNTTPKSLIPLLGMWMKTILSQSIFFLRPHPHLGDKSHSITGWFQD